MNQFLFFILIYVLLGFWWSATLHQITVKELDINGLGKSEKVLHNILWPLSIGIFIIRFIQVFLSNGEE